MRLQYFNMKVRFLQRGAVSWEHVSCCVWACVWPRFLFISQLYNQKILIMYFSSVRDFTRSVNVV